MTSKKRLIILSVMVLVIFSMLSSISYADVKFGVEEVNDLMTAIKDESDYNNLLAMFDAGLVEDAVKTDARIKERFAAMVARKGWKKPSFLTDEDVTKKKEEIDKLNKAIEESQKDAASAESTASAVKYGGIGVVVLVIVIIIALGMRKYGSARTMLTPGGTSLGQQAAAEVTENQEELEALFRRKQEILGQYQDAIREDNIAEARRLYGNR